MLSASRYILNGSPHHCAFCSEPLTTQAHRRANQYFCNELCADAGPEQIAPSSPPLLNPVLIKAA